MDKEKIGQKLRYAFRRLQQIEYRCQYAVEETGWFPKVPRIYQCKNSSCSRQVKIDEIVYCKDPAYKN